MAELNSSESMKENILMAVRGDMLVYLENGDIEKMNKLKERLEVILGVPIIIAEIPQDIEVKDLKENTALLTETFKHLINEEE